jgi:hypothetical protein
MFIARPEIMLSFAGVINVGGIGTAGRLGVAVGACVGLPAQANIVVETNAKIAKTDDRNRNLFISHLLREPFHPLIAYM